MNVLLCQRELSLSWASTDAAGTGAAFAQQTCFSMSQCDGQLVPIPSPEQTLVIVCGCVTRVWGSQQMAARGDLSGLSLLLVCEKKNQKLCFV